MILEANIDLKRKIVHQNLIAQEIEFIWDFLKHCCLSLSINLSSRKVMQPLINHYGELLLPQNIINNSNNKGWALIKQTFRVKKQVSSGLYMGRLFVFMERSLQSFVWQMQATLQHHIILLTGSSVDGWSEKIHSNLYVCVL